MDLSSILGGAPPEQAQKPAVEYTAQAASPAVRGEVTLTIGENALTVTALFDTVEIPFVSVDAILLENYVVTVRAESGDYHFSRMGQWAQAFYDALCEEYGKAVLGALFVEGSPLLTASGDYRYAENTAAVSGFAPVRVFENCVVTLPPDVSARRVPLCFVSNMETGNYELTLTLDTGERYTYAKLGYETAPFAAAVEKQIRALREKALSAVREIDPSLTAPQAAQLAKVLRLGAAASMGTLRAIAPTFVAALEKKLSETRAAEYYAAFKQLCDPAQIYVGFRKNDSEIDLSAVLDGVLEASSSADGEEAQTPPDPYLLWLIAPSPDGQFAAVEFAEADSATFVYKTGGDFAAFAGRLNRALEAIDWKREVIRMSDAELRKPDNAAYFMAAKRTASLQFVRANFVGRLIHTNPEAWKRKLTEFWSGT
jgi:hypothetical protein